MANRKRRISGPGAADFIAAPGGEDIPGVSPSKGETELAADSTLTDPHNLEPDVADDDHPIAHRRERGVPRGRNEPEK